MAEIQTNIGLSPQILRQLRLVKKEFSDEVLPRVKAGMAFQNKSRQKKRPSCRKPNYVKFSPFAMTLGNGFLGVQSPTFKNRPVRTATMLSPTGQLISVFVVAVVKADPPIFVLQKIRKKSAPGFPGGGVEKGETILQAGTREFKEEGNGGNPARGVDITPYNPVCIGKFVLDKAMSGEQGAVVLVEIPESEIANLKTGGGAEKGEIVENVFFMTFDEITKEIENKTVLPNSARVWNLYLDYLVNMP